MPLKVLAVDDLPSSLLIMQNFLALCDGLRADTAVSGREALELVKSNNYGLIFMDQMMPEMDGIETAASIRKIEGYANTPIIALTANAMRGMKEFYQEKSFQDYLLKPITPEALDEILKKWLNCQLSINNEQASKNETSSFSLELEAQRLDMLKHYLVSFTNVPETDWQAKFDTVYFVRFTALIRSLNTAEAPAALREQQGLLVEAGRKEDTRGIREALPAFCGALQKWREQEQEANADEGKTPEEILPRLKKAILAGETEAAEAAIGELGHAALTPAGRELYFQLYALMLENNTEKIMEVVKEWA